MKVAVYGSLKQGHGNHRLLEDSVLLGQGVTLPNYTMYSMGGFPCITEEGDTAIHIEVYEVTPVVFDRLDMLEGYPNFYNRKQILTEFGYSWIYYIKDTEYLGELNIVTSGRW